MIQKVLEVIQNQKAEATIVAPWWPGQQWCKTLMEMSVCPLIKLPKSEGAYIPQIKAIPEQLKNSRGEDLCLEGQWRSKLNNSGWSNLAIMYHSLSLAETTKKQFSNIIQEYMIFCGLDVSHDYPPMNTAFMANCIANIRSKSDRPKSKVNVTMAALSCFYQACDKKMVLSDPDISRLVLGITKGGTKKSCLLTPSMPIKQFKDLILSWPENSQLQVAQLRLKCITSLALVLMLRPSDIAPKGIYLDADEGVIKQV